jgi:tetratricopeptide (TPR) repeat protein
MKWNVSVLDICLMACLSAVSCASAPSVEGLLTLDEAMAEIAGAVEACVELGTEVGLTEIDAPLPALADFLYDELLANLGVNGKLIPLARGKDMEGLDAEHQTQMSGRVDDKSAVGVGHYLGAEVMLTASFSRFRDFSQFSVRALDVRTGAVLVSSRPLIRNDDPVLAGVTAPLRNIKAAAITENALAHLNRGKDFMALLLFDDAIGEFDKALAVNARLEEALFLRGDAYRVKGNYNLAITDYTAALALNSNNGDALLGRASAYWTRKSYALSIADYTAALALDPKNINILFWRTHVYQDKGDYDRAIEGWTVLRNLENDHDYYLLKRGQAYFMKGDLRGAAWDWEEFLKNNPHYATLDYDHIGGFGIDAFRNGDYDRAIAVCDVILSVKPDDTTVLGVRAFWYEDKGDYDRAIADWTTLIRVDPGFNTAGYYNNRGLVYDKKGEYDKAIVDYTQALRLIPSSNTYNNRGNTYYNKKDYARARADWEQVLRLDPDNAGARNNLEKLRQMGY